MFFGNQYEPINNPRGHFKSRKFKTTHRWSVFLTIENDPGLTSRYIDSVVYYLHPCYKINVIKVLKSPFLLSRTAFGNFVIGIEVYFKEWTKVKPIRINHILHFSPEGRVYAAQIESDACQRNRN
jgi:transcription initiation factor IIF auxiliary subunit